jgi:hypothetical protein
VKTKTEFQDNEIQKSKTTKEFIPQQIKNSSVDLLKKAKGDSEALSNQEAMPDKETTPNQETTPDKETAPNQETTSVKKTAANKGTSKDRKTSTFKNNHRPHIKITTRRALLKKALHQCEHIHAATGRCPSKFQLQVDHQRPLALGGSNDFSNLRILCQQHNLAEARRWGIARL